MSVQAGIWNFDGEPVNHHVLAQISQSLAEYGPDGESIFSAGSLEMLYRPFHTTAESRLERQPFFSKHGAVITWDGRLDNRDDLLAQLCERSLQGQISDVAIVAMAFDRWGTACFEKLIGDWAASLWNAAKQELVLARDYIGVRDLFYYSSPGRVIWCNHLSSLALCGSQFTLCDEYYAGYLGSGPGSHLTPYRDIHSVAPGSFVCIRCKHTSSYFYWTCTRRSIIRYKTDQEYEEQFRHLFRQSVKRRLRTDSPILAELSGGLDSSSIVCMADDILASEGRDNSSIDTFSAWDRTEPEDDDFLHIAKVEEQRGRVGQHAEVKGSGNTFRFDYPVFVCTPGFAEREEFKEAESSVVKRGGYRVLLSGEGGDHILGQSQDPRVQLADLLGRLKWIQLCKLLTAWSIYLRQPWVQLLCQSFMILLPTWLRTLGASIDKYQPWLNKRFAKQHRIIDRLLAAADGPRLCLPSVRESFQTFRSLAELMSTIRPYSVDVRYPYLDQTLTEFMTSIPPDQLLRPGERRSLLRRALLDMVPKEVLSRRTKASASRCYVLCLQEHWKVLENILTSPIISQKGYINQSQFIGALRAMKNGLVPPYVIQLFRALSLELWLRDAAARGVISAPSASRHNDKHSLKLLTDSGWKLTG